MKTLAAGAIMRSNTVTAIECLHYALNLPVAVVITGMDTLERVDQAVEAMRTFKPMSEAEVAALAAKTKDAAMTGNFEGFKTGAGFDGTARNPQWLG
jgi:predicted aldo/keto reductase-like oxidoreductase